MPTPFLYFLKKKHTIPAYNIIPSSTPETAELGRLLDSGHIDQYQRRLIELGEQGKKFVQTEHGLKEIAAGERQINISIAVQVKGYTITWYFWTKPEDQDLYSQEWRDTLYDAAAECHSHVQNGCGLYYRGSNAFHLKTMHHLEREAYCNHNHYRMRNNQPVTPKDFQEHMQGFKSAKHTAICAEFFDAGEIETIINAYNTFYAAWTTQEEGKLSQAEVYLSDPTQQLTPEDILEFRIFGAQQEPCRLTVDELNVDYETARRKIENSIHALQSDNPTSEALLKIEELTQSIKTVRKEYKALLDFRSKGGSRGLGSDRAWTRQLPGSVMQTHPLPPTIGHDAPRIPEWAKTLQDVIDKAVVEFLSTSQESMALSQLNVNQLSPKELTKIGIKPPETIVSINSSKDTFFQNPSSDSTADHDDEEQYKNIKPTASK